MAAKVYITSQLLVILLQRSLVDGQCGGVFTEPEGSFASPHYPDEYPNNTYCEYLIEVESENGIQITFTDFELEECPWDFIEITYGSSGETETYCGALGSIGPILESSSSLRITFTADAANSFR